MDSDGKQAPVESIDALLQIENHRRRPPILDIDLSQDPLQLQISNISFLEQQQMYTHFSLGVFITRQRKPYNERTVRFDRSDATSGVLNILQGEPCDAVLHEINADGTLRNSAHYNKESANAVRRLLTVSASKLRQ